MKYNLTPLLDAVKNVPSSDEWKEKITTFFNNENYDAGLLDYYYNVLINDIWTVRYTLECGYLVDDYSGLFSFDTPETKTFHTFNMANFVRRNHQHFYKKSIQTMCGDYGILNLQIRLCGLDLKSAAVPAYDIVGAVLAVIGNNCSPYAFVDKDCDVIFACNVFTDEDTSYRIWSLLYEKQKQGKEVFITSNTFHHLKNIVSYDKLKQMENPSEVYDAETYSNLDLGFMNKIYRIV